MELWFLGKFIVGDSFFVVDLRNLSSSFFPPLLVNLRAFAFLLEAFTDFLWHVEITSITDFMLCFVIQSPHP